MLVYLFTIQYLDISPEKISDCFWIFKTLFPPVLLPGLWFEKRIQCLNSNFTWSFFYSFLHIWQDESLNFYLVSIMASCKLWKYISPKRLSMLIVINFSLKSRTRTHVFTLLSPWKTLFQFYIDFVRGFHCIVVSVSIVIIIVLQNVCVVVRMSNILHGTFEMPFLWGRWYTTSVVVPVRNITNIELLSCRSCEEYYYM